MPWQGMLGHYGEEILELQLYESYSLGLAETQMGLSVSLATVSH